MEKQAEDLKNISSRYEHDKKKWATAISNLQDQVEVWLEFGSYPVCINYFVFLQFSVSCLLQAISITGSVLQLMKKEHFHLSLEAHECADSIPELNKMVFAVEGLGMLRSH